MYTTSDIDILCGVNKYIIDRYYGEMGISVLFHIEKLTNNKIKQPDNRFYFKDRQILQRLNIEPNSIFINREIEKVKQNEQEFDIKSHFPLLEIKNYEFIWDDRKYYLSIFRASDTIQDITIFAGGRVFGYLYHIVISTDEDCTHIDNFIVQSRKYYRENILEEIEELNKVRVRVYYDGRWELLHKIGMRALNTLYLPDKTLNTFIQFLDDWKDINREKWYNEMGIPYKMNILLHGYPGTGKTSLINAVASKYNMDINLLNFNREIDDTVLMRSLRGINNKTILVLEDIDALFEERKKNDDCKNMVSFSGLLNVLDGIASKDGLITFITTNYKARLDKALIRPGRIDYTMDFGYSTKQQIEKMFQNFFPEKNNEEFSLFWKHIKDCKITMCQLQQYFFECNITRDLIKNIDAFINLTRENNYHELFQEKMYM